MRDKSRGHFLEGRFRRDRPLLMLYYMIEADLSRFLLSMFLFVVKHSPVWVMPIATGNIVNALARNDGTTIRSLWVNGSVMMVFILQNVVTNAYWQILMGRMVRQIEVRLRSAMVRQLQELSFSFHDEMRSGQLQSKIMHDVESIQAFYIQFVTSVFSGIVSACFALLYTVTKTWTVALFYLAVVPVALVLVHASRRRMRDSSHQYRKAVEETSAQVIEMIEMIPVSRAHGLEQREVRRMDRMFDIVRKTGLKLDVVYGIFGASSWVAFQSFQALCFIFCATLAFHGRISIGDVLVYYGFFGIIAGSISQMVSIYPSLAKGLEAVRSVGEIVECPDLEFNAGKRPVTQVRGEFEFQDVSFTYPGATRPAVRDFSLRVRSGDCVAFVGESGSGKSTLMSLVIGFRRPLSGRILLDGVNMEELDLRDYRKFLAVVPQQTVLFSGTVRENITYGVGGVSDARLREVLDMANCTEFVSKLPDGLDTSLGEHGKKLSGGQRQRISIARALIRDPRVIILDEATSSLDVGSERLVQEAVDRLIRGRTTLIVAHRFSTIRKAARVIVMRDGVCVEQGTLDELTARQGEFFRLKSLQS